MGDIEKIADWLISFANKGGALSTASILFLWSVYREYTIFKRDERDGQQVLARLDAWQNNSKAEEHQTTAIGEMADRIEMNTSAINAMASQVATMVALVKDRRESL